MAQERIDTDHLRDLLAQSKDKVDLDKEALKKATRYQTFERLLTLFCVCLLSDFYTTRRPYSEATTLWLKGLFCKEIGAGTHHLKL